MKVGESRNFSEKVTKLSGNYNNYNLAQDTNGECCDKHFGILYEFLH